MNSRATADTPMTALLWLVRAVATLLIAFHLAAPYLPEQATWGIFPYTYWPRWLQWAAGLMGLALCVGPVNRAVREGLGWVVDRLATRGHRRLWYAGFSLLMAIPFWVGRIVHTRWGDAYILVNAIPHPDVRLTYTWQAPFDVLLHAKLWALAHGLWGWDAMQVYHVVSTLAGVVFIFLLLCMADDLGRHRVESATMAALVGTLGLMQFFFGYIENYVLMTVGILVYLWLGVRHALGGTRLAWPASALAATSALHPSGLLGLGASLVWLWARGGRMLARRPFIRRALEGALPLVAGGLIVLAVMHLGGHGLDALLGDDFPGGGDRSWFVPLSVIDSKWEHYTMFSWAHLLDFLNEQVLVAPFGLALVVGALATRPGRMALWRPEVAFLAVAAAGYLVLTWVWNPDYGGRRDWDLFAPAALPLMLLASLLLIHISRGTGRRPGRDWLGEVVLIVAGVSLIFTLAWVYSNTIPWSWDA